MASSPCISRSDPSTRAGSGGAGRAAADSVPVGSSLARRQSTPTTTGAASRSAPKTSAAKPVSVLASPLPLPLPPAPASSRPRAAAMSSESEPRSAPSEAWRSRCSAPSRPCKAAARGIGVEATSSSHRRRADARDAAASSAPVMAAARARAASLTGEKREEEDEEDAEPPPAPPPPPPPPPPLSFRRTMRTPPVPPAAPPAAGPLRAQSLRRRRGISAVPSHSSFPSSPAEDADRSHRASKGWMRSRSGPRR
jgi:hypothetical protein